MSLFNWSAETMLVLCRLLQTMARAQRPYNTEISRSRNKKSRQDAWDRFFGILVKNSSFNSCHQPAISTCIEKTYSLVAISKRIANTLGDPALFYQLPPEQVVAAKMMMHQTLHLRGGFTNDLAEDIFHELWNLGFDEIR